MLLKVGFVYETINSFVVFFFKYVDWVEYDKMSLGVRLYLYLLVHDVTVDLRNKNNERWGNIRNVDISIEFA